MRQLIVIGLVIGLVGIGSLGIVIGQKINNNQWLFVRSGINSGISGMTLLDKDENFDSFLVVHDNKSNEDENRLAIVTITTNKQVQYFPLKWTNKTDLPIDLEAITRVPGEQKTSFIAVSSRGKLYHFSLDRVTNKINLIQVLNLPEATSNSEFEAFALQKLEDKLIAVWAHRGEDQDPAIIYWGDIDLNKSKISRQGSSKLEVPFPVGNVRHISDLKVDTTGIVYITSATDNGNNGPFDSAVYLAGVFNLQKQENKFKFKQNQALLPIYRLNNHKVEAIELVSGAKGGIILGTDDENMGSSVWGIANHN